MIDEKFSAEVFSKLVNGSREYDSFLKDLADEMASQLDNSIQIAFRDIADNLRALGHDLKELPIEYDTEFHSTGYEYINADEDDPEKLRIWLQTQTDAMSGFIDEDDFDET